MLLSQAIQWPPLPIGALGQGVRGLAHFSSDPFRLSIGAKLWIVRLGAIWHARLTKRSVSHCVLLTLNQEHTQVNIMLNPDLDCLKDDWIVEVESTEGIKDAKGGGGVGVDG